MRKKILLIDGHSILNRAFFGLPDLTNSAGLHTNAIYGFLNILFKTLEEEQPDYLTVAFDVSAPTFRHALYAPYKGTRKPMADELRQQVPVMKEVLTAMRVEIVEQAGLEADDILGTLARRSEQQDLDVVILSGDRDLLQLATERTKIRIPKTSKGQTTVEDYLAAQVTERYQVTPTEFIDVKALMGDTSDNIPGVPSIGEKTAVKIISEYHSIENAYAHAAELKPPRAAKALTENWDQAVLSKTLATIDTAAQFEFGPERAVLQDMFNPDAYRLFQQLEFKNLYAKFDLAAETNQEEQAFVIIEQAEQFAAAREAGAAAAAIGLAYDAEVGLALALPDGTVMILPAADPAFADRRRELLGTLKGKLLAAFNIKRLLWQLPLETTAADCFDTAIAAYLLNPLKNDYTYIDVAKEYLDLLVDEKSAPLIKLGYEAYVVSQTKAVLTDKLTAAEMLDLFRDIELPLAFALFEMEQAGVRVDAAELKAYGEHLGSQIEALVRDIYTEVGEEFNINSPKQLGVILFEKLGLPSGKKTKTGYSTAAGVLEKLAPEYPIVDKILYYRQLTKLKSTYADGLAVFIREDGRIHGTFNQTIAATGRISSTEPNLQNIPIRVELGRQIRKVFIPAPEYCFIDADYSQIELRILAHYSNDEHLLQAYREHSDIHRITASKVFHVPFDEVTPLQRRNAKAVNFGIVYGISSFGLSRDLSISRKEAAKYIDSYFETYPGIKEFLDGQVAFAKQNGYVTTMFGRRRPIPELSSSNFMQRSFGERVAMNSPIQGSAADIMKIAMIKVDQALKAQQLKSRIVLQVHDELLIETHETEVEQVKKILVDGMENAVTLNVPLEIDIHQGQDWYNAK